MSCKSNNDKGKGCLDGDCVYPFIPNYVYCHDPDGKKNKTPVFTPVKHKKNGKMICATTVNPKKVMKTYGYVSVKDIAKDVEKEGVDDKKVKGVKVNTAAVSKKDDAKVDDAKVEDESLLKLDDRVKKRVDKGGEEGLKISSQIAKQFNITASSKANLKGRYVLDSSFALASKSKFPMPGNIDPYHGTGLVYRNRDTGINIIMGSLYGDDGKYYRTWWINEKHTEKEYVLGPHQHVLQTLNPISIKKISSLRLNINVSEMIRPNHDIFHVLDENTRKALLKIGHSKKTRVKSKKKSIKKRVYLGGERG